MNFLNDNHADVSVEWIMVAALLIVVLAPALLSLFGEIQTKLQDIKNGL